uniref:RNase H type-1 domain-containing protein n=1 Tax=Cannabis sativa TaxID=3483 RepID=A0A803P8R6_CANSA
MGSYPYLTWRVIMWGKELLVKGLWWKVGNGANIFCASDPWLPSYTSFKPLVFYGDDINMKVVDLLLDSRQWDVDLLRELSLDSDVNKVLSIPLTLINQQDILMWHHETNGQHTVKSGYALAMKLEDHSPLASGIEAIQWWKNWSNLQLFYGAFGVKRNRERHGTRPKPADALLYFAYSYIDEFKCARKDFNQSATCGNIANTSAAKEAPWMNPPSGCLKLNTDATIDIRKQVSGFGAVVRNSLGDIVATTSILFKGCFKPEIMEALALMHSLQCLQDLNLHVHLIETDSLLVVKGLDSLQQHVSDFHCLLNNISLLVSKFPGAHISHVFRSANTAAHLLAQFALSVETNCSWLEEMPLPLMPIVL